MKEILRWIYRFSLWFALLLCSVIFLLSMTAIMQYKPRFDNVRAVAAAIFLTAGLTLFCVWVYWKMPDTGRRTPAVLFLCIVGLQVFFLMMVSRPMSIADPARVQNEALSMLKYQAGQVNEKNTYFQNYPNNHFIVIVFYYFYKLLGFAGITKVWIPTVILNTFCIDAGILCTYGALKKIKGTRAGNMALFLSLFCPTTYMWLTSAYTNTFSFPFVMAILYLGIDVGEKLFSEKIKPGNCKIIDLQFLRYYLLGILAVVGYFIRPTTIIAVIAVFAYHIFLYSWKRAAEGGEASADRMRKWGKSVIRLFLLFLVCGITWSGCSSLVSRHVDAQKFTEKFPVIHWIMMGMNEESGGGYSREDRLYTGSLQGLDEKRQGDMIRLMERLQRMGIRGVGRQFIRKLTRVWAMGDDDAICQAKYAGYYPPCFPFIAGNYSDWFVYYMQAYRMMMFFMMACALIGQLCIKECVPPALYSITFLGTVLFFLIWEAGKRYNICFNGVCILLMAEGTGKVVNWLNAGKTGLVLRMENRKSGLFFPGVMIFFLICGVFLAAGCEGRQGIQTKLYYQSKLGTDAENIHWKGVGKPDLLEQTIEEGKLEERNQWNRLKIYFANRNPKESSAEYLLEVISLEDNHVVLRRTIAPRDVNMKKEGSVTIKMDSKKKSRMGYKLCLKHIGERYNLVPMVCKFPLLDPYPYGSLSVNHRERDWDLSMSLYRVDQ